MKVTPNSISQANHTGRNRSLSTKYWCCLVPSIESHHIPLTIVQVCQLLYNASLLCNQRTEIRWTILSVIYISRGSFSDSNLHACSFMHSSYALTIVSAKDVLIQIGHTNYVYSLVHKRPSRCTSKTVLFLSMHIWNPLRMFVQVYNPCWKTTF